MLKRQKESKRKAFVLMPIASKTSKDYAAFQKIFEQSIRPLLEELNYSVKKAEDPLQMSGLNQKFWDEMMQSDLVIADVSSLNPNFYYRLDVRFRINSLPTIILINEDKKNDSYFEVEEYPTVLYNLGVDGLRNLTNNLLKLISEFNFPFNRIDFDELDPAEKISKAIIDVHRNLIPESIIKEMEESVSNADIKKFIDCVQNFLHLDSFRPSENDYALVYFLSDKIKEGSIVSNAILDIGLKDFPESEKLFALYALCLSESQRPNDRLRARKIVKDKLKIKIAKGSVSIKEIKSMNDLDLISILMDSYHRDGEHHEALRVTSLLYEKFKDNAIVLRNHARALERARESDIEFILSLYQRAMFCLSVDVTTARWYAATLIEQKMFTDAIEVLLFACLLGLDDAENFSRLAYVVSNLIQPSNPVLIKRLTKKLTSDINNDVVLEAIILSESCKDFSAKHRFMNENSLKNIGYPKEFISNFYLTKYKGGDISRPDRYAFVSKLYNILKTERTSEELYNLRVQSTKKRRK